MNADKKDFKHSNGKDDDAGPGKWPTGLNPFHKGKFRFSIWHLVIGLVILMFANILFSTTKDNLTEYSVFKQKIRNGEIQRIEIDEKYLTAITASGSESSEVPQVSTYRTAKIDDPELISLLDEMEIEYYAVVKRESSILTFLFTWIVPLAFVVLIWRFMSRRMGNMGGNVLSFGKNKAQIVAQGATGVRFDDVAGTDEAKHELVEVVDFLKKPEKYTAIGGKIPTGLLLVGPPGTGKTMLAKAVAGEAAVPFFKMSGADFVEMFVGVGAARVRDLFKQAREKAPCIIFIDELDAIGKTRAYSLNTNDEREQTLNQLLVEMDGFDTRTGVMIILAATNRPEILDPALLRPGRFDRQVVVDKPDLAGRKAILAIHAKTVKLEDDLDLGLVARSTPGLTGADLANIVNEAALLAVRAERQRVKQEDFSAAIEKLMTGLEKKSKLINPKEKRTVAYHETGHAVVARLTDSADPVEKISIIPRGIGALGFTLQLPTEERYLMTEEELLQRIDVLLGGRAAEQLVNGQISTGAANDLSQAADIVRKMITEYGMSEKFQNVYLPSQRSTTVMGATLGATSREYSEATQQYVDEEIARIINTRYQHVLELLRENEELLHRVAAELLEKESLTGREFRTIVEKSPSHALVN